MDRNDRFFYYSLGAHVIVLTMLVLSFSWSSLMPVEERSDQEREVINATMVQMPLRSSLKTPLSTPPPPAIKPIPSVEPPKPEAIPIANKKPQFIKIKKVLLEKQLLEDLKKQKKPPQKINSKSVEESLQKEMSQMKVLALQKKSQEKNRLLNADREQHARGEVDKYKALILQMISQNWIIPSNIDKTLFAELLIHVAPGGVVLDVQLIKSSGNDLLDRSARAAVFKSSPLPVPADVDAFEPFKQFMLKVKPENVLAGDAWLS